MATDFKLKRGSLNVLNNILSAAGWYEGKPDVLYCAGKLIVEVLPVVGELSDEQKPQTTADLKKWLDTEFPVTLTDSQIKTIKMCLEFCIKKSQLTINPYTIDRKSVV